MFSNVLPFYICKMPHDESEQDHIAAFDERLNALLEQNNKVLFNDVKATRSLKTLLSQVLGNLKDGLDGHGENKRNAIARVAAFLAYLRNETDELPEGMQKGVSQYLDHRLRTELSTLLNKPKRFGEVAASITIQTLELLLSHLERVEKQYRPRQLSRGTLRSGDGQHIVPNDFCPNLVREISAFLPVESQLALRSVSQRFQSSLSPDSRCWLAASEKFHDMPTFRLRMGSLKESWADDGRRRATALKSWVTWLTKGKVKDTEAIFQVLFHSVRELPAQCRSEPLIALITSLPPSAWSRVDQILYTVQALPAHSRATALQSLIETWRRILQFNPQVQTCEGETGLKRLMNLLHIAEPLLEAPRDQLMGELSLLCKEVIKETLGTNGRIDAFRQVVDFVGLLPKELLCGAICGLGAGLGAISSVHQFPVLAKFLETVRKYKGWLSREQCGIILTALSDEIAYKWTSSHKQGQASKLIAAFILELNNISQLNK